MPVLGAGATMDPGLPGDIADTFNGLMAIPNLIALFLLGGVVVQCIREHDAGEKTVSNNERRK